MHIQSYVEIMSLHLRRFIFPCRFDGVVHRARRILDTPCTSRSTVGSIAETKLDLNATAPQGCGTLRYIKRSCRAKRRSGTLGKSVPHRPRKEGDSGDQQKRLHEPHREQVFAFGEEEGLGKGEREKRTSDEYTCANECMRN